MVVDNSNRLVNEREAPGSNAGMENYEESNNRTRDSQHINDPAVQEKMSDET